MEFDEEDMAQTIRNRQASTSSCHRKKPIVSLLRAERQAAEFSRRTKEEIKAYKCPSCPFWHVGHPLNKKEKINDA